MSLTEKQKGTFFVAREREATGKIVIVEYLLNIVPKAAVQKYDNQTWSLAGWL